MDRDKSTQQFAVIGLGRFGRAVAKTLVERGHEVLGIDAREDYVQQSKDILTFAVQAELFDGSLVRELGLDEVDAAIVAVGDNVETNIFSTTLLLEAGVPWVVARATSALHALILKRIGAHQVVYPELDSGSAVARGLRARGVAEHIELTPNIGINKLRAPDTWSGSTLAELRLTDEDPSFIALVIQRGDTTIALPGANQRIEAGDTLVVLSQENKLDELLPPPRRPNAKKGRRL